MLKPILILALVLTFVTTVPASELRRSTGSAPARTATAGTRTPPVVARARVATPSTGNLRSDPNLSSIRIAAQVANQAAACTRDQQTKQPVVCSNIDRSNRARNLPITNLAGYRVFSRGVASCYGTRRDGFGFDRNKLYTALGLRFKPTDMTAACAPALLGKMIVVRNVKTQEARAVTCTDTGAFNSKYGRIIDLAASVFDPFGLRCDQDGLMRDVEILVKR